MERRRCNHFRQWMSNSVSTKHLEPSAPCGNCGHPLSTHREGCGLIYVIGSLRQPDRIRAVAKELRRVGYDVFDDWLAAGPIADDSWKDYEVGRGRSYEEALKGHAAKNVFAFDLRHLERASTVVLVLPAGKSGHLELGWALGKGKRGFVFLDDPDRWDVMYQFATGVFSKMEDLLGAL